MTASSIHVILVEDSPTDAKLVVKELERTGRAVIWARVDTEEALRERLAEDEWDLVLSDWSMPAFSAPRALAVLRECELDIPFIIVSGTVGEDAAVDAMRAGARDYVLKDRLGRLGPAIERELAEQARRASMRATETARVVAEEGRLRAEEALRSSEEQLRQAQKMEAIGRLAGGIAHDFNNLLTVILSYAEMVLGDLRPADPMRGDIDEMRKAALRATSLTRQLLLFARRQQSDPQVLDLAEIIKNMDAMLQRILGEDIELVSLVRNVSTVKADPSHMEQVILNLVVNARDAMPTGGKLTIEVDDVTLDDTYAMQHLPASPGHYVMLAVSDTGCGMSKETQSHVFEPFFTTKERGKGTGLGLSTVFGIVQQAGGTLWVYSELGNGTTFKIYLPQSDAPTEVPKRRPPIQTLRGTETILVVEDDEQVRSIILHVLDRQGYRALAAEDARQALEIADGFDGEIDLLLTDVVMRTTSGPELAKAFAARRPDTRVLYMSGYTDDSVVRHGILEQGAVFLQKPVTPAALAHKIREVLD